MYFVTGANGLVGSYIVRQLIHNGDLVKCLIRPNSDKSLIKDFEHSVKWIVGDILDVTSYEMELHEEVTIIHTAAVVSFYPGNYDKMYDVNVEGTNNLINAAIRKSIKKFVFVSSVAALGKHKNSQTIDELAIWENSNQNSVYAKSKYLSELAVWRGMEEGLQVLIVNPSIVLGPGNWNHGSSRLFKYVWNEHWFYPLGHINFVDVRDLAEIVLLLNKMNINGERFLINGGKQSFLRFFTLAAKLLNKKKPFIPAIPIIAELGWRFATVKAYFNRKEPFLTKETARASKRSYRYDTKKLNILLNFNYRNLNETLDWIAKAYISSN